MSHLQCKDAQLFVHLAWSTQGERPILGDDESRQAAYLAITTRTRSQFCHVLAIGGTACQIEMVVRFPASLPITTLLSVARNAAEDALARQQGAMPPGTMPRCSWGWPNCWEPVYTAHTLNAAEAAQAKFHVASLPFQERCA